MHTLGIRLRELRKKQGLTQTQVAERLGVSKAVVSSYEVASRCPSYDILIKLATLYNVSTDYLLGLEFPYPGAACRCRGSSKIL